MNSRSFIELYFNRNAQKTKRNDVIKMQIQTIEFSNVDEIIEMIDARFSNANVEMIESYRVNMIAYFTHYRATQSHLRFDFDFIHTTIEKNVRENIAMHYVYEFASQHDEFENIALITNDIHSRTFDLIDVETNNVVSRISIDDKNSRVVVES